jgi:hypothetical protein
LLLLASLERRFRRPKHERSVIANIAIIIAVLLGSATMQILLLALWTV